MTADLFGAPASGDVDDFLGGGGGGVAAKFPSLGHSYTGIITAKRLEQQRDYNTKELAFWPDGKPKMQAVVTITTDAQGTFDIDGDPQDVEDDNGERVLYVKGYMQNAIRDAVRASGAPTLELFGKLTIRFSSKGKPKNPAFKPPKLFTAEYVPADKVAKNDPLLLKAIGTDDAEDVFAV